MLSGNSLRRIVHTHPACVHQAAKSVAALSRVARVTAGPVESSGSLPPGVWLTSPAGWLPRTRISSGTLCSAIDYGLPLPFCICLYVVDLLFPSVLWRCWFGGRKGIRPVKKLEWWGCWHGYVSGAMCRLAYGPADATVCVCVCLLTYLN